ncbi:TetR/AcrR family transcriptional regulator; helix-turn-helix transcriptional regulator [Bacillus sp. FJAT-29790]|uniref:TetR/AcrR family transcriptional regulator n=1 Tax=Bacillus sp. FJAT-29790 TaxID=1895002 RepID=UPI001C2441CD|nr:TetR/AcrR family transcriptional regulator [Bacillus sp. FJAT-29790]MBU8880128.1 TetR/AcrR family transcriptional regulator; helix-turn-helix transcriptional regulator [Bacillus sp. FJAT-29790]
MTEKEKIIIESAIKLFASKGYSSTSIQEIANVSGISKGAFYLSFKSKEKLLESILAYYFEQMQKKVNSAENMDLPPREKFIIQLNTLFETVINQKDFIIMQSREQAIPLNRNIKELIYKMHMETQSFYQNRLLSIYGNSIQRHVWDLSFMLEGLFQSYIRLIFLDKHAINLNVLSEYIMRRMDSIVSGIGNEHPIITEEKIQHLLSKAKICFTGNPIQKAIDDIKKIIAHLKDREALEISLEVLEAEIIKDKPRIPVIQGMLSNFKAYPELDECRELIASEFNITLTD